MISHRDLRIAEKIIRGATYASISRETNMSLSGVIRRFQECLYGLREAYPKQTPASIGVRGIRTDEHQWLKLIARYRKDHAVEPKG